MREQFLKWLGDYYIRTGFISSTAEAEVVWQAAYAAGVAAERERAAKACESEARKWEGDGVPESMSRVCAAAIRSGE